MIISYLEEFISFSLAKFAKDLPISVVLADMEEIVVQFLVSYEEQFAAGKDKHSEGGFMEEIGDYVEVGDYAEEVVEDYAPVVGSGNSVVEGNSADVDSLAEVAFDNWEQNALAHLGKGMADKDRSKAVEQQCTEVVVLEDFPLLNVYP